MVLEAAASSLHFDPNLAVGDQKIGKLKSYNRVANSIS